MARSQNLGSLLVREPLRRGLEVFVRLGKIGWAGCREAAGDGARRAATWEACRATSRKLIGDLEHLVMPPRCLVCGVDVQAGGAAAPWTTPSHHGRPRWCLDCVGGVLPGRPELCCRCGTVQWHPEPASFATPPRWRQRCRRCPEGPWRLEGVLALAAYEGVWRDWVLQLKRRPEDPLLVGLAEVWLSRYAHAPFPVDLVLAIPPRPSHLRFEVTVGLPQALARRLADGLRVPWYGNACRFVKSTAKQAQLTAAQRRVNMRGAFAWNSSRRWVGGVPVQGKRVLIVDDVLTTGATLNDAARVLREAGAREVWGAVIARGLR